MSFLIVAALLVTPAFAQSGSIQGKAIDKDGKPMVGLTIAIDRKQIAGHFEVKTDGKGQFFHAGLPTGQYKVSLMQNGTALTFVDNVRVTFGGTTPVDFDMKAMAAQAPAGLTEEQKAAMEAEKAKSDAVKGAFQNGLAALQAKQYADAANFLKTAADADPTQHVIFGNLAEAYAGAKKYPEAIAAYNKAIELKPDDFGYYNNLGIAYGNAGQVDDAVKALGKAAELNPPQAAQAYYNLGAVLTNKGKTADAATAFRKVIEIKPDYAMAYYNLGISLLGDTKTMPDSVPVLQKFIELQKTGAEVEAAKQLIEAAQAQAPTSYKSDKQIAAEKAAADKAEKDKAAKDKAKTKKP